MLKALIFHVAVMAVLTFRLPLAAATVRASFLVESAALRDTLDILRNGGCTRVATGRFQRAVERYSSTAFDFDFRKFPKSREGFYTFESASRLVAALPFPLSDTPHDYEFNCFDTVVTLAGEFLPISNRPDELSGPFLVPYTTNGVFSIVPKATAREAFLLVYPPWYREVTEGAMPEAMRERRVCLTAALFRCHVLP